MLHSYGKHSRMPPEKSPEFELVLRHETGRRPCLAEAMPLSASWAGIGGFGAGDFVWPMDGELTVSCQQLVECGSSYSLSCLTGLGGWILSRRLSAD